MRFLMLALRTKHSAYAENRRPLKGKMSRKHTFPKINHTFLIYLYKRSGHPEKDAFFRAENLHLNPKQRNFAPAFSPHGVMEKEHHERKCLKNKKGNTSASPAPTASRRPPDSRNRSSLAVGWQAHSWRNHTPRGKKGPLQTPGKAKGNTSSFPPFPHPTPPPGHRRENRKNNGII